MSERPTAQEPRPSAEGDDLLYDKRGGVAWITINRPQVRNALRATDFQNLMELVLKAGDDPEIGVIIVTGSGDKSFCSGGDVRHLGRRDSNTGRAHMRRMGLLAWAFRNCGKPVIAAVNGFAIGGGHELHLMCDITIAAEHAMFGQTGPRVGSVPVWGATQLLSRHVGEKKAREILFFCRQYTAEQALAMGLINAVVPMKDLYATADAWAQELLDKSPEALRIGKLAMNHESDLNMYSSLSMGAELLALHYDTPEFQEGPAAFLEKRKPDFRKFRRSLG